MAGDCAHAPRKPPLVAYAHVLEGDVDLVADLIPSSLGEADRSCWFTTVRARLRFWFDEAMIGSQCRIAFGPRRPLRAAGGGGSSGAAGKNGRGVDAPKDS